MPIFNSLGSNYNLSYVLKSLFSKGYKSDAENFKKLLEQKYNGKAILFYKGREALTAALKILDLPKNSAIAINGFTCVAVFNAIRKAGYEPVCLDLAKSSDLNFNPETLEKTLKSDKNIKVVVIQNTFGYPCNVEGIQKVCEKHNLILIEDLAHCVGARYTNGKEAGTVGDFVILSFSQDKIIDAVSGGALVIRNEKFKGTKSEGLRLQHPNSAKKVKDKLYPLETYKIRALYKFGLGKPYHLFLKKLNLLSDIMNPALYDFYSLPKWHAALALIQFESLEKQLAHRKFIAKIYEELLPSEILIEHISSNINSSSNLRFPILVDDRTGLIKFLKGAGVYISDIWYDEVAPECPNAVNISKRILNLPTHINVADQDARKICGLINSWIKIIPGVFA